MCGINPCYSTDTVSSSGRMSGVGVHEHESVQLLALVEWLTGTVSAWP